MSPACTKSGAVRWRNSIREARGSPCLTFPGTNSEDETLRLLRDCGGDADLVHWSRAEMLAQYDAYVLPGGFAYEDRDPRRGRSRRSTGDGLRDRWRSAAAKLVLGICNGAQILLEAGLVPGTGELRRPTAAFTYNGRPDISSAVTSTSSLPSIRSGRRSRRRCRRMRRFRRMRQTAKAVWRRRPSICAK